MTAEDLARYREQEQARVRAWRLHCKHSARPTEAPAVVARPRRFPDLATLRGYRMGRITLSAYLEARATLPAADRA